MPKREYQTNYKQTNNLKRNTNGNCAKRVLKNVFKMDNMKKIKQFFIISNSIFDLHNSLELAFKGYITPNKMQQLHKMILEELNKEKQNLLKIDFLLSEMELLTKNK